MQKDRKQQRPDYTKHISDSQNFITSQRLIQRIVHLGNINKNDTVLEIGTGKGHLTEILCRKERPKGLWDFQEKRRNRCFLRFIGR